MFDIRVGNAFSEGIDCCGEHRRRGQIIVKNILVEDILL
jgi:hypothetical protein